MFWGERILRWWNRPGAKIAVACVIFLFVAAYVWNAYTVVRVKREDDRMQMIALHCDRISMHTHEDIRYSAMRKCDEISARLADGFTHQFLHVLLSSPLYDAFDGISAVTRYLFWPALFIIVLACFVCFVPIAFAYAKSIMNGTGSGVTIVSAQPAQQPIYYAQPPPMQPYQQTYAYPYQLNNLAQDARSIEPPPSDDEIRRRAQEQIDDILRRRGNRG